MESSVVNYEAFSIGASFFLRLHQDEHYDLEGRSLRILMYRDVKIDFLRIT